MWPTRSGPIEKAIADQDPTRPPPTAATATGHKFATAADVRAVQTAAGSTWEGFIPSAKIFGIAAPEGVGKTRFCLDLCRRAWHGPPLTWPDGQTIALPPHTPSLWLSADGHHDEVVGTMADFGLPDEAVVFPAPKDEPYANASLDDKDTWKWVDDAVATVRPWCLFIDTLTYATSHDLCEQEVIARLKTPLVNLVQTYSINVALLLHVSLQGQALGRRIKGVTRTLIHLEAPDPDRPERVRLWVEKTSSKSPNPLGVTITAHGNDYDSNPPAPRKETGVADPRKNGIRHRISRDRAVEGKTKGSTTCSASGSPSGRAGKHFGAKWKLELAAEVVDGSKKPQIWH